MAGIRVVLDTNVLVSGLVYPGSVPGRIVHVWRQGGLDVILSRYILDEMVRVLPRLFRIVLSAAEIRDLADSFLFVADIVEPSSEEYPSLRDQNDQPVQATLHLITGDKDLLALADRYPIVTPAVDGRVDGNPHRLWRTERLPVPEPADLHADRNRNHRNPAAQPDRHADCPVPQRTIGE